MVKVVTDSGLEKYLNLLSLAIIALALPVSIFLSIQKQSFTSQANVGIEAEAPPPGSPTYSIWGHVYSLDKPFSGPAQIKIIGPINTNYLQVRVRQLSGGVYNSGPISPGSYSVMFDNNQPPTGYKFPNPNSGPTFRVTVGKDLCSTNNHPDAACNVGHLGDIGNLNFHLTPN